MPFLVWDSPAGRNVRELDRALVVIGRDAGSDLVLDDPTVSRRHALVQVEGATVKVTDLRTTAGTRINGARLAPDLPCTLDPGDFLQVGKVVLSFHAAPP
ncbi:MAG: FHA domain-containing protein, partial [Planctomycetes bacterium]|nr:FHA domain-containing protein [Planctomycetota bacterium]